VSIKGDQWQTRVWQHLTDIPGNHAKVVVSRIPVTKPIS
jgi:hypothetical protein